MTSHSRDIQQYGLKIKQEWLNGYDQALLSQYQGLMQGVYVDNVSNVPFEAAKLSELWQSISRNAAVHFSYEEVRTRLRDERGVIRWMVVGGSDRRWD